MYAGLYFTHLISLSVWFGALIVVMVFLRGARLVSDQQTLVTMFVKGKIWLILQMAALAVLGSGIGLIVTTGLLGQSKPLWLKLMEEAGGMVALLFVILVTLFTRSMRKASQQQNEISVQQVLKRFLVLTTSFIIAISSVILIVSMKLT